MKTKYLVVHCSASNFGNACLIDSWHRERGFAKIGYHYVVLNGKIASGTPYSEFYDGLLETGRHFEENGAHAYGHNVDSIGVCLIGNTGEFTSAQMETLRKVIALHPEHEVVFHSDLDEKKAYCPGLTMNDLVRNLC